MEYDKALYRVYEKTIEDISTSRRNRLSRNNDGADRMNVARNSASLFSASSFEQSTTVNHNDNFVPFLVPNILRSTSGRSGGWKLVYQKFRYRLLSIRNFNRNSFEEGSSSRGALTTAQSEDSLEVIELMPPGSPSSTISSSSQSGGLRRRQVSSPRASGPFETSTDIESRNNPQSNIGNSQSNIGETDSEEASITNTNSSSSNMINTAGNMNNTSYCGGFAEYGLIFIMRLAVFVALVHLVIIFVLHSTYVGPRISKIIPNNNSSGGFSQDDSVVSMTCLERALSTRPLHERSNFQHGNKQLLGDDELLQINVIDEECVGKCSIVRKLNEKKNTEELRRFVLSEKMNSNGGDIPDEGLKEWFYGSQAYWTKPKYRFATDKAILDFEDDMLFHHNISVVNVTLTARCLGTGSDEGDSNRLGRFLMKKYGYDTAIMNQLMYGIKTHDGYYRDGHVWQLYTSQQHDYTASMIEMHVASLNNTYMRIANKMMILLLAMLCFFFTSSVTAMTVRVLTSSGVLILFPFFSLFRMFGMDVDERVLDYAHPWLGVVRSHIEARDSYSMNYFVVGHLGKLILGYSMYEACQLAWVDFFYRKAMAVELPLWSFASLLVIEYFSLIYVRSAPSAYFFPRYMAMLFIGLHIYLYSTPCGFFILALVPYAMLMMHVMIFTLLSMEVAAVSRGAVSSECPREVYVKLCWSEWTASLPPEWTIFHPLNARYIPLHDRNHDDDDIGSGSF